MTEDTTGPADERLSPLTAAEVARGVPVPAFPVVVRGEVWWQESRPDEGGRTTILRRLEGAGTTEVLTEPWNAHTRVHEYGGRSYLPVAENEEAVTTVVFSERSDQRLYRLDLDGGEPRPLTPEPVAPAGLRYSDLAHHGDHLVCIREEHREEGVRRAIVALPLSGQAAHDPQAVRILTDGADFYASPSPSPDGQRLAWITWSHPRMPWDGTELRVAALPESGPVVHAYTLKGGIGESVLWPQWRDATTVCFVSDWPGWWNLYQIGISGPAFALCPVEEEFSQAPFQFGVPPYRLLDNGAVVALHGHSDLAPSILDPGSVELRPVETGRGSWTALAGDGATVVGIGAGTGSHPAVMQIDPVAATARPLHAPAEDPPPARLSSPRSETFAGRHGRGVHAHVFPPSGTEGPAAYIVWVHGGPTGVAGTALSLERTYFTERGIGVVAVNYGGSCGYGRSYRSRLHRNWGVLDVEEVLDVAEELVRRGEADPARLAIRGGSAGGLTTLLALTAGTFSCGVSLFGVTDLLRLAKETHDFESHYLDSLVGPLPGYEAAYAERSPINRVGEVDVPVLLLQGSEDPVVPPSQATEFAEALAERGVPYAYREFPGEGHGFRAAESRARALEAELGFYAAVFGLDGLGVPPVELTTSPPRGAEAGAAPPERAPEEA